MRNNEPLMVAHTRPPNFFHSSQLQFDERGHLKHLLTIEGMPEARIISLLDTVQSFIGTDGISAKKVPLLKGRSIFNLFFETSTRTRSAFELAAKKLSADVINFYIDTAAVKKGESLLDTLKNIHAMGVEVFVIRHKDSGAAEFVARQMDDKISVINAGDGSHAHPTQALLDMFTIRKYKQNFTDLKVAIVGDVLHSRVARSEIAALKILRTKEIRLIAPPTLMPVGIEHSGVKIFHDIDAGLEGVDVIIILRLQKERMQGAFLPSEKEYYQCYGITPERLQRAAPDAVVMHPGPINRGVEISSHIADGPQSLILKQVSFGIAVRMAVISLIVSNRENKR